MSAIASFFKSSKTAVKDVTSNLKVKSAGGNMAKVDLTPATTRAAPVSVDAGSARSQRAVQAPLGPAAKTASVDLNVQPGKTKWSQDWSTKTAIRTGIVGGGIGGTALFLSKAGDYGKQVFFRQKDYYNEKDDLALGDMRLQQMQEELAIRKTIQDYNQSIANNPGGTQNDIYTPGMYTEENGGNPKGVSPLAILAGVAVVGAGGYYLLRKKKGRK